MIRKYLILGTVVLALGACLDRKYDNPFLSEGGSAYSDEWKKDWDGNGISDSLEYYAPGCNASPKECLRQALVSAESARNIAAAKDKARGDDSSSSPARDSAKPDNSQKPPLDTLKPVDPKKPPMDSVKPSEPVKPPKDSVKPSDPIKPPKDSVKHSDPVKPPVIPRDTVRDTIIVNPPRDTVRDTIIVIPPRDTVIIAPPAIAVTGIQASAVHVLMGAAKAIPSVSVLPNGAKNRGYTLVSLDETTVKVSDGDLVPVKPGTAKIRARSDEGGFTADFDATVFKQDTNIYEEQVTVSEMELTVGDPPRSPDILWKPANVTHLGYTLTSSNPAAVSVVSEGGIARCKAVAAGVATLTLTTQGKGLIATFKATAKAPPILALPVLAIAADDMTLDLGAGDASPTVSFTPMLAANKSFTLSSDKPDIVSVSGTSLHAVAGGETRITLTSADGPSSSFKVTVRVPVVSVSSVSAPDLTLAAGGTAVPAVSVLPANAGNKAYTLTSDKPKSVTVQGNGITAVKSGSAIITITAADGGITGTFNVIVTKNGKEEDD
ncbi:MAG: hypothetical protein M3Y08_03000 [Fibrobacterota bacterium]|nr:hypothetical protein [Fibrobacterota bacterium]